MDNQMGPVKAGAGTAGVVMKARMVIKEDAITKRKWVNYLWDTFDKPREERKFLFKLDAVLLTFASLGRV